MRLTHGLRKSSEYNIWANMKARCYNKNNPAYKLYGGRGILICKNWLSVNGFLNFYKDMGSRPSLKHSIDRINNNRGYSKSNCRWTTWQTQAQNTRKNVLITYRGKTNTISEWSRETGLKYRTIHSRLNKNWQIERIFMDPYKTKDLK